MKSSETGMSTPDHKSELISQEITEFKKTVARNFEVNDSAEIYNALDLMIELHSDQRPYSGDRPYIGHPLAVAADLLNNYGIKDKELIIAGLLHDAVEDQSLKLQEKRFKRLNNSDSLGPSPEHDALLEIRDLFGQRVKKIVARLTNPNFKKIIIDLKHEGIDKTRDELYAAHVSEAISDTDTFIVKFADFMFNAEAISKLPEKSKDEKERKQKFKHKYGPVLKKVFLPAFIKMKKDQPMYPHKKEIIVKLREVIESQYS